jgi:putative transposase
MLASTSTIRKINQGPDAVLWRFANGALERPYAYLILDARCEKGRREGVIHSQALLIAISISAEGRREVLAVEAANCESGSSSNSFLGALRTRGWGGIALVVFDDHHPIKHARRMGLPEAARQRYYAHFLRNALDQLHLPRRGDDDCLQELHWINDRRNLIEAQQDLAARLKHWDSRFPRLTDRDEEHHRETLTFYCSWRQHHKHLKSTNSPAPLDEENKLRTRVLRIFPTTTSCLRLVLTPCIETHETWMDDHRYFNMDLLKKQEKDALRRAA